MRVMPKTAGRPLGGGSVSPRTHVTRRAPKSPYWWTEGFGIGFRVVSPVKEATAAEKAKYWDADSEAILDVLKRDREIRQRMDELGPKK